MTRPAPIAPHATFGQRKPVQPEAAEVPAHIAAEWTGVRPESAAARVRALLA